ncbi:acyltransferase family-domain-containing protein [Xylariales sp. AK1849]|nr:acyltransferase family-domain-containing protein [Xylariales sp. AK1849]
MSRPSIRHMRSWKNRTSSIDFSAEELATVSEIRHEDIVELVTSKDLDQVEKRDFVLSFLKRLGRGLLPSFLQAHKPAFSEVDWNHGRRHSSRFTPLDGLRGYAALAIMNYHILRAYQSFVFYGYGLPQASGKECARDSDVDAYNRWFHQLPILRMFYSGTWPISVFFVLSGFALSYKPLKEARLRGEGFSKCATTVASSLFRRPCRLYLPPLISSFITLVAIQLGAFEPGREIVSNPSLVPVVAEIHPPRFDNFMLQLVDWLGHAWGMLQIFRWEDPANGYDIHLWTIPTEFRCSLAIFLITPVYVRINVLPRQFMMGCMVVYVYTLDRWDVALFLAGLLVADFAIPRLDEVQDDNFRIGNIWEKPASRYDTIINVLKMVLLMISLLLLSSPELCASQTPGYQLLSQLIPSSDPAPFRFLPNLGGILLVALIIHTRTSNSLVKILLSSALPQYLGQISYSLYIVHGPLIHALAYVNFQIFWSLTGTESVWSYTLGFIVGYVRFVGLTIWIADIFWSAVDEPCVRLARFMERLVRS